MRYVITAVCVAAYLSSDAMGFQTRSGGAAAREVCPLLTRDLAMKVSTAAGKSALERVKPIEDWVGQASREAGQPVVAGESSCMYGRILLVLNPLARPDQVREAMRTRTAPYKAYDPVEGVGDAAFFAANSSFANLYVWSRTHHFHIQMGVGFEDDAKALKPNVVALANAIIPQLR
jgi:hypothetical protein